jgi:endogenous inhibitor of DNA gyrase (YacG/DUF329 family)
MSPAIWNARVEVLGEADHAEPCTTCGKPVPPGNRYPFCSEKCEQVEWQASREGRAREKKKSLEGLCYAFAG